MNRCENCKCNHDGTYGSGRFCTPKCARGFSTKNKRNEINEKVSKNPELILDDPYDTGCLIRLKPSNFNQEIKLLGL